MKTRARGNRRSCLFGIYTLGTLTAFVVARLLREKLGPDATANHFMLELPPYRAPQWSYIFRHVFERGWSFVAKAGTIILGLSILLWALSTYPKSADEIRGPAFPQRDGPDRRGDRAGGQAARLRWPRSAPPS